MAAELGLPAFGEDDLRAALPDLCAGRGSFEELRRASLETGLRGRLTHAQLQALEREAPERIEVPTGSRIALTYEPGRPPVLAVRIQGAVRPDADSARRGRTRSGALAPAWPELPTAAGDR
jgi:hypothetical protein